MGIVENTYAELKQQELKNNPYSCLHMADIDINPHQIEAFTFALSSLELGGAILADEVGLGKTIEAGLVIKYLLCSGKNKILLIMPSNLRKQWQVELEEKFDIDSLIVDSSNWEDYLARVKSKQAVIIVSYHFASKRKTEFGKIAWDFCVFDEAHRLRNVYKNGSKMANSLYELTKGIPKILLTATPMQNTLLDIYGLVQFIDDRVFYSKQIFSERYLRGEDYNDLKACLEPVVQRTLRKEVAEYIQFSERKEMTIDFELSPMEIELYVMINNYLKKEILYALPNSHRTLITSVIRKLLASSSMAVAETFKWMQIETVKSRSDKYEECYAAYCQKKGWENFKPRNAEYVLLHTLSHMLIKEMSMQSGYSSSALHERIYSSENMCGILIYTGAADKEGSLGGLVELGGMNKFLPLLKGALENGLTCTTDPECFMKNPTSERLNGAACHSCTMISETACENGNRLLDRALVVPVPEHEEMGYFRELVRDLCGIQV